MNLFAKLFLAIVLTNMAIIAIQLGLTAGSLTSDFATLVQHSEQSHVEQTRSRLLAFYQRESSWQKLRHNRRLWQQLMQPQPGQHGRPVGRDSAFNSQLHSERRYFDTGKRISLYDSNKQRIEGKPRLQSNRYQQALELDGELIGWLGWDPARVRDPGETRQISNDAFISQQLTNYLWIALSALLLALLMAWVISKLLSKPIGRLMQCTDKLMQGDYSSRVGHSGRDELGVLAGRVDQLAQTLEDNAKNRRQWMSDTSHELRTPLTVLKTQLTAIEDGVFSMDASKTALLLSEVDNLSRLVDDLYQLTSADVGNYRYTMTEVDPLPLLMQLIQGFESKFAERSIALDLTSLTHALTLTPRCIVADKARLHQLFSNLIENARRYTDEGGQLRVVIAHESRRVIIRIEDSAPGVTDDEKVRLFERFYRVEPSRSRSYGGSGLGLSLCKTIVEAHQGTITLTDSSLGGLCVTVCLPYRQQENAK
ncbi:MULTISPECIES: ATP-binding protein [unclassified Pseudoalteromonas]|uniref:ATP-binding protein n=1 Tax=unclassified Pseudoalteromonas TaxID=194690 RepID=UPI0020973A72|nr:ATP-binding protein [Pseudoalteromonas sp. XMcav2-N]MCO7191027.1 ATP-binding protein [Pseudoalteromonas sp. XMcav2-N]